MHKHACMYCIPGGAWPNPSLAGLSHCMLHIPALFGVIWPFLGSLKGVLEGLKPLKESDIYLAIFAVMCSLWSTFSRY